MRKTLVIMSLIAVTWLASAGDSFAQLRIRTGGGRGITIGGGGGYGGYGNPYYGNSGYYGNRGYGYGSGYYGNGYYGNGYYGNNYGSGYYSTPGYYADPAPTIVQQSYYSGPTYSGPTAQTAMLTIIMPDPNAELFFNDVATSQRGIERTFQTPTMYASGTYTLRARWLQNGQVMEQTRRVDVQPGQSLTVNFR